MNSTPESDPRPDPTSDLHWSDFRGAIHDIFAANAAKHPERPCVVETASSTSPERIFSYRQIHEASNILAHHFVQNGVQRGEVVMVYAHRGVDLVVAVMGVLKAGATFSVIDPTYPPDRQVIFLDVAKPRALVIIEKATQYAGAMSNQVRSYIADNLKIRTEVPALMLQDDGSLSGGIQNAQDCLQDQVHLKSELPGVVVGPDSTPTLSFTSGSEGRPKGVRGRHFSLAYYFPWMQERFHLTENERFTMLSGIAHDPIQRDMFTPLFLGAQLYVPPTEDIAGDRLASWAARNQVTVTHLTPAMGDILYYSDQPKIMSLKAAFFVGDILKKSACRRMQSLAPNCTIINMYGTTETQRAVSFYEIPSRTTDPHYLENMGGVIPAGKGMSDVQLLVVDRTNRDRLCDVGESGEIYVRAGGLAEGYLGSDLVEATREKFVQNWFLDNMQWVTADKQRVASQGGPEPWREFYLGPRDRLYRSGDLGKYMADGNVECTGRADNQVKIRGFRIELGEIDTYISHHPLVRENVTLVRRDKDEEHFLVSYIVPDLRAWEQWNQDKGQTLLAPRPHDSEMVTLLRKFKSLTDDIRASLKTKLASYAVPTIFIPMVRFPLNPNGKVDKKELPYPNDEDFVAAAPRRQSLANVGGSTTEAKLARVWAGVLRGAQAEAIGSDDSFFDIGGNSINLQLMQTAVKKQWEGVTLPTSVVFQGPTLAQVAGEIDKSLDPTGLRLDAQVGGASQDEHYAAGVPDLLNKLPRAFPSREIDYSTTQVVFLTGATGFLGAFILRDLLESRQNNRVIAHVRAESVAAGLQRIRQTCEAYGIWSNNWTERLECITGDLQEPSTLGVDRASWDRLTGEVDLVIHNGARVHWVLPYSNLKASNVFSTLAALRLCAEGRPKRFAFVSSTSVLDTEHFVNQSEAGVPISEEDDLEGSRQGLGTGYGQSKWVSEQLVREAGRRGLKGSIVRSGYVMGDPVTGSEYLFKIAVSTFEKFTICEKSPKGSDDFPGFQPTPTTSLCDYSKGASKSDHDPILRTQ
ncbi:large subunit of alpha-aminoadipate reductase [Elasticomyces elasticus]|nr:large subunit of alpha-aminoadipate reductase [Elasticomyces elasticus]